MVGGLEVGLYHGGLVLLGVEGESEDGVILEVLTDWKVEPLGLSGQSDASSSVGDNCELIGWTDTTVKEDSWRRQSASGKDQFSASLEVDNLSVACSVFGHDTADCCSIANGLHDFGEK